MMMIGEPTDVCLDACMTIGGYKEVISMPIVTQRLTPIDTGVDVDRDHTLQSSREKLEEMCLPQTCAYSSRCKHTLTWLVDNLCV